MLRALRCLSAAGTIASGAVFALASASLPAYAQAPVPHTHPSSRLTNSIKRPSPIPAVIRLCVEPEGAQLLGPRAQARLLVTAHLSDGTTCDVTGKVTRIVTPPGVVASVQTNGTMLFRPLKDGVAMVKFTYAGRAILAKVAVKGAAEQIPVSFANEVVPMLTRAGCNQGVCHGAQYGKGGFKLSLAGFDPEADYLNIVKQARGRRVALADPARSLLLLKPMMRMPHGGGMRLQPASREVKILLQWLREGAPGPNAADPQVIQLAVFPAERILQPGDPPQRLAVSALYSDGTTRDVTDQARLNTLNDAVAACTPEGVVTPVGRGQTAIMVRYGGQAAVATVLVPFSSAQRAEEPAGRPDRHEVTSGSVAAAHAAQNGTGAAAHAAGKEAVGNEAVSKRTVAAAAAYIDTLVAKKQRQLGLVPSPVCDDRTFLRRVSYDLIGSPPTPDTLQAFVADTSPNRRARIVDALLEDPAYADFWTLKWGDLLRSRRDNLGVKGMWSFTNWIRTQFQQNRSADKFVHELILAQGSTFTNGPSNYYRVANSPQDLAETTSQVFLGVRLQCARCHHHPFEKWSQADYYQFAAFFARVGLKGSDDFGIFGNEQVVRINDGGEVRHPKTNAVMRPTPLGVPVSAATSAQGPDPNTEGDRRRALADWLTSKENRLFARNIANRYWGYLFGKGIVNLIDDQRVTNPPTNPELLDFLADELIRSHYDLKHLLRLIANTQTYQRSSEATAQNRNDELFFTHYMPRRLPAESLLDAIDFACGTREKFNDLPLGTRAIQLPDPAVNSDFLDTFGRPPRQIACECERGVEPNLSQTLRLMNGELINRKVAQGDGRIARRIAERKSDEAILNELYLVTLGRPPRRTERIQILGVLAFSPDRKSVFEDVLLTLLNSKEFLFNH